MLSSHMRLLVEYMYILLHTRITAATDGAPLCRFHGIGVKNIVISCTLEKERVIYAGISYLGLTFTVNRKPSSHYIYIETTLPRIRINEASCMTMQL